MRLKKTKGFAIVAAVFLLLILSSAGIYLAREVSQTQQVSTSALNAARAYHAANSGIEHAAYHITRHEFCANSASTDQENIEFPGYGISVTVSCVSEPAYNDQGSLIRKVDVIAKAEYGIYGINVDYVKRVLASSIMVVDQVY